MKIEPLRLFRFPRAKMTGEVTKNGANAGCLRVCLLFALLFCRDFPLACGQHTHPACNGGMKEEYPFLAEHMCAADSRGRRTYDPTAIISTQPMRFPWPTQDPFLMAVYHEDKYPKANDDMGPDAFLGNRRIGMDFEGKDGWRMYHGTKIPGFPQHPHKGFETVTFVRRGMCDHTDTQGAAVRFGDGDALWLTAGKGTSHSEMFPLRNKTGGNTQESYQIWINLPARNKLVDPGFAMLWSEKIPKVTEKDENGKKTEITVIAGAYGDRTPLAPPVHSWAHDSENHVAIWVIRMDPGANWQLPASAPGLSRNLYFYEGVSMQFNDRKLTGHQCVETRSDAAITVTNDGSERAEILVLQGRPIKEPIARHGPFVMNTQREVMEAYQEYRETEYGGWPWPRDEMVHPRDEGRFAKHADGRVEGP